MDAWRCKVGKCVHYSQCAVQRCRVGKITQCGVRCEGCRVRVVYITHFVWGWEGLHYSMSCDAGLGKFKLLKLCCAGISHVSVWR